MNKKSENKEEVVRENKSLLKQASDMRTEKTQHKNNEPKMAVVCNFSKRSHTYGVSTTIVHTKMMILLKLMRWYEYSTSKIANH